MAVSDDGLICEVVTEKFWLPRPVENWGQFSLINVKSIKDVGRGMLFSFGRSKKRLKEIEKRTLLTEEKVNHIYNKISSKNVDVFEKRLDDIFDIVSSNFKNENILKLDNFDGKIAFEKISEANLNFGHADQAFGAISYAQHGDDFITLNLFNNLGINYPSYLDIGAHHPYNISNTALLYKRGCRGVNVEANPNLITAFYRARPEDVNLNFGVSDTPGEMIFYMIDDFSGRNTFDKQTAEEFVAAHPEFSIRSQLTIQTITVNDIVKTYCGGIFPDFLTIDVEGLDSKILKSIDFKLHSPKIICVEVVSGNNSSASSEIIEVLKNQGFTPYIRALSNIFFVRNDLIGNII